jgi:hypothetical protein
VGSQPAHHADVRLDPVPAQAAAVEDAVVGGDVPRVGVLETGLVAVEAVGVLHHELPRPQDAGPRSRLVALLHLELVEDQGQVAIGADLARHVIGDGLLVGHREHQRTVVSVAQAKELGDLGAPGAAPELLRLQDGHQQLPGADRVELLPDDLLDAPMHSPARRQPCPHARSELPHEARADHQHVRDRLGVRRSVLQGGQEVLAEPGHRTGER